ncbi:MAG TPA: methionyl-tRNA formyltransferase [Nocardioidaceae bacterium]|nr:methionyl-tRNA formyltransferase [Nocardioidaceae bacterium]
MRVVFAGTPEAALPSLRQLLDSSHEVVAVVTRPDARTGRGRRLSPSPVGELAARRGIEVLKPVSPKDPEFLDRLRAIAPACAPVVAYGGLLPQRALDIPEHGWVNLHFSLLPAWRGAAPVQHALLHGDEITGATTFRIVPELDAGPVFGVFTERVRDVDTSGDLLDRLAVHGAALLVATLDGIESGSLVAEPQPAEGVTLAPKVTVDDARLRWSEPALAVDRRVRACTPAPGAWTTFRGDRLKLGPVALRPEVTTLRPGEVAAGRREVLVGAADHAVRLGEVRAQGKKAMPAADWARGVRPEAGEEMTEEVTGGTASAAGEALR